MSWLKRNPEELQQRLDREVKSDREFYQSLPRMPVTSGRSGSGGHGYGSGLGYSSGEEKREGSLPQQFREDMEEAWGNIDAEEEVVKKYINKLSRGQSSFGRTKAGSEKTVERWRRKFEKEEGW